MCRGKQNTDESLDVDGLLSYAGQITSLKDAIFKKAKGNIDKAQDTYKKYYDKKHDDKRVSTCTCIHIK